MAIQTTKLTDMELLAYYEKMATLALTMNHILNSIPDDQFQKQMKHTFGNTLNHSNLFCKKLREEIYNTLEDKDIGRGLNLKSDFVIPTMDMVLSIASTCNTIAYAAFKNEMVLTTNRIINHYCKDDPNVTIVDTKTIEVNTVK